MPLAVLLALLAAATPPGAAPPGPTLAVEDTLRTEVSEVLVRAPRITLDEILDRVARGEARRDSALRDVSFTATLRVVRHPGGDRPAELLEELVSRVYKKKPDKVRSVALREWKRRPGRNEGSEMRFSPATSEQVVNFAFRPEARRDYRYRIVGRDLLGDHLVYRIAFTPRAQVASGDPGGVVWVDTRDFVIVREELDFSRSPVPLLLKGIERAVIERREVAGHWMLHRLLMRAEFTLPVPRYGRSLDIAMSFDDYAINRGIDDTLFFAAGRRR
jgi:hypothetical protein